MNLDVLKFFPEFVLRIFFFTVKNDVLKNSNRFYKEEEIIR